MALPYHIKGIVAEVGEGELLGRAKVMLPEYDGLVTDWLPVVQPLTFDAKAWAVPRKDTQVIVLPGNTSLLSGAMVELPQDEWLGNAGVWTIAKSTHDLSKGGYTTKVTLRKPK